MYLLTPAEQDPGLPIRFQACDFSRDSGHRNHLENINSAIDHWAQQPLVIKMSRLCYGANNREVVSLRSYVIADIVVAYTVSGSDSESFFAKIFDELVVRRL